MNPCLIFANSFRILLGDFNAHHVEWGSERSCKEGISLLDASLSGSFTDISY